MGDTAKQCTGRGLGLSAVQGIVRGHGGGWTGSGLVLLVDDDPQVRAVTELLLRDFGFDARRELGAPREHGHPRRSELCFTRVTQAIRQRFDFTDYVLLEESSTVKHEYLGGLVWAMAGGSPAHARIAANVATLLATQLSGKRCAVYSSDLRVRVAATGLATYPDITVVCGHLELDPEDIKQHTVINPSVVVEVLSPSTEEYDRGEKLLNYQQIPSLREVVLVAQDERRVEVWRRGEGGWFLVPTSDGPARLATLDCQLPLASVYADPLAG